jgi:hypothetical protein
MDMRRALVTCLWLASLLAACAPEGSSAYVSKNLLLDSSCKANSDDTEFLAIGNFDIAAGWDYDSSRHSTFCENSYFMHLVINSNLKANANDATGRAEPNVLQITEAEVRLVDIEQQATIPFDKRSEDLPNPFRVKANNTLPPTTGRDPQTGVVAIEAIPVGYAEQLKPEFVDKQIMAEVQIFGTTLGDVDIDFRVFSFPIGICEGCLTRCKKDYAGGTTDSEIYGDMCDDNGGQDGRVCVDPDPSCEGTLLSN